MKPLLACIGSLLIAGMIVLPGRAFFISGGGCLYRYHAPAFIVQVRADGVVLAEPQINSPDAVNPQGRVPDDIGQNTCEGGRTSVGLADAVFHTRPIALGLVEPCSKFSAPFNAPVGLSDAIFVTPYISKKESGEPASSSFRG